MYNVRVKRFGSSSQIQFFDIPISSSHECFDIETGEIIKKTRSDGKQTIENPFTGEYERVKVIDDRKEEQMKYNNYCRAKNVIYDIARANDWEWFLTFTFDKNKVNRYDYDDCSSKLSMWLRNNKKRKCPDMIYLVVPEQHKDGAYHFHGLFSNCIGLGFVDSGKKDSKGRIIYNVSAYKYGFTTATCINDSARSASYLCKYVTKELVENTKGKHRYWASKNCNRPVVDNFLFEGSFNSFIEKMDIGYKSLKQVDTPFNRVAYIEL